jgi:hypothetical protein
MMGSASEGSYSSKKEDGGVEYRKDNRNDRGQEVRREWNKRTYSLVLLLLVHIPLRLLKTRMHISCLSCTEIEHTRRAGWDIAAKRAQKILSMLLLRVIRMLKAVQSWRVRMALLPQILALRRVLIL